MILPLIHILLALLLAPILPGVVNRVKAFFGGRRGQPLLQTWYDMARLIRKGAVYSTTTTWIFRVSALTALAGPVAVLAILPLGGIPGALAFRGDLILLVYLFASVRFFTVLAAMDTGSSFGGMGASREVQFSVLAETAFMLCLAALAAATGSFALSDIFAGVSSVTPVSMMTAAALLMILLTENARIPVDDPGTHLELTMIHEAMILDHCGVDLCFIQYGAAVKLWIFSALFSGILFPLRGASPWSNLLLGVAGIFITAVILGIIESTMARLRLTRLPQMLSLASVLALTAIIWELLI
jgi:formate hydrogenlyase subunit 4